MNWTVGKRLAVTFGIQVVITLIFGGIAVSTLNHLKVNGPIYQRIVQGKDLIADILPPPEYIVESYLTVFMLTGEKDKQKQDTLIKHLEELNKEYEERHIFWEKNLEGSEMKKTLLTNAYSPTVTFFQIVKDGFIPAIRRGDMAEAQKLAYGILYKEYSKHRTEIDKVVALASARNENDEFSAAESIKLRSAIMFVTGIIGIILTIILAVLTARSIVLPISQISKMTLLIASGNIYSAKQAVEKLSARYCQNYKDGAAIRQRNEVSSLIGSIASMTENLNSLVFQVQKSIVQTASSVSQIAISSKEQEVTVGEVSVSATEIAASSEEIAATSRQIANSMNGIAEAFNHTAEFASHGHSNLNEMQLTMEQLAGSTESISAKLATINERGKLISDVVVTITQVADQTNLLSLNAAIEAEKAGEYGKGFSVVASEIRRLADQTAVATLDIAKIVRDMQMAVSSGVMEMDKFSNDVREHVKNTGTIIINLESIMEEIQSINPIFNNVVEESKQQAEVAKQISEAIVQLSDATKQAAESLREFNDATKQLSTMTQALQKEISIFNVGNEQNA